MDKLGAGQKEDNIKCEIVDYLGFYLVKQCKKGQNMGHCWVFIMLCCILLYYISGKLEEGICSTSQSRK